MAEYIFFIKSVANGDIQGNPPGPKRPPRQVVPEIEHIQFVAMENKYGEQVDVLTNTRKVDPDAAMKAIRDMCSPVQVKK